MEKKKKIWDQSVVQASTCASDKPVPCLKNIQQHKIQEMDLLQQQAWELRQKSSASETPTNGALIPNQDPCGIVALLLPWQAGIGGQDLKYPWQCVLSARASPGHSQWLCQFTSYQSLAADQRKGLQKKKNQKEETKRDLSDREQQISGSNAMLFCN